MGIKLTTMQMSSLSSDVVVRRPYARHHGLTLETLRETLLEAPRIDFQGPQLMRRFSYNIVERR